MLFLLIESMTAATAFAVFGVALLYVALVLALQRKLYDPLKLMEHQVHIKRLTNEMKDMIKSNQDVSGKQKELYGHFKESMKAQVLLFAVLPLFFIFYYLLLPYMFSGVSNQTINIIVPLTYQGFFVLCAFILGLALGLTIRKFDSKRLKKRQTDNVSNAQATQK
ncbi:MAG: hypothetical protein M1538_01890 [Candidatus Marsarchaeota archaeon]|jgi:uncharacterized membrane protein (DUF106 family)|nr:hypothetical protein [Candidatus Marsarchaeota archaeon]